MMTWLRWMAVAFAIALPSMAFGDSLAVARPTVIAVRLTSPIDVDGKLDEPVWHDSVAVTDFKQSDPLEGAPASMKTEVRVAYDDEALYIGARMYDPAPDSIVARLTRRDVAVPATSSACSSIRTAIDAAATTSR